MLKINKNKIISSMVRNKTFDLLRGLAILSVIFVHVGQAFPTHINYIDKFLELGRFGVQLFFYVSALTMCYMWQLRIAEKNQIRKFYLRRFLRIAPLFWVAIPVYLLINVIGKNYWVPQDINLYQIILTATFLHGFRPDSINSVVPGGWSIAVEMTFYVLFPLLITKINDRIYFLYLAIVFYFLNLALTNSPIVNLMIWGDITNNVSKKDFLYLNFFNQFPVFLMGCYLYKFIETHVIINIKKLCLYFLMWIFFAVIMNFYLKLPIKNISFLLVIISEFLLVLFVMRYRLCCRILERLGKNSYAIYLGHFAVIKFVGHLFTITSFIREDIFSFFVAVSLVISISYVFSICSYYLVEKRIHNFAEKITS